MYVMASCKTNAILEIECTEANLDWLAKAVWADWGIPAPKRERKDLKSLPELTQPNVKWAWPGNGSPRIKASYRKPDGRIGIISKPVPVELLHQDEEMIMKLTVETEKAVQAEYDEKHTPEQSASSSSHSVPSTSVQ